MGVCRYETVTSLRASIFGEILLCRDRLTHERVVLKTVELALALKQTSCSQELVQENVLREVEVLSRIHALGGHPNVINLRSYFVAKGGGFLHVVLDYCEGGDLLDSCVQPLADEEEAADKSDNAQEGRQSNQQVAAEGESGRSDPLANGVTGSKRLQESVARGYLADVLSGLRFLHSHGIAHRDLSLENILLRDGRAVIADFGLCVQHLDSTTAETGGFCCDGTVGKHYYMAPEIVARERYDPRRADVWSVGIAFFILLTSSPPFEKADPSDPGFRYVAKRGIKAVFTAWGLAEEVSQPMQDLLARMLSIEPEERITVDEIWQHPALQAAAAAQS
ncbi:hypothetical protein BBJ28_00004648 [Nothophytophthora sp. Chile5]|nr:hypothetical protein BBJ28_00004648 [Nothophytophthora sp. Chile5]